MNYSVHIFQRNIYLPSYFLIEFLLQQSVWTRITCIHFYFISTDGVALWATRNLIWGPRSCLSSAANYTRKAQKTFQQWTCAQICDIKGTTSYWWRGCVQKQGALKYVGLLKRKTGKTMALSINGEHWIIYPLE